MWTIIGGAVLYGTLLGVLVWFVMEVESWDS